MRNRLDMIVKDSLAGERYVVIKGKAYKLTQYSMLEYSEEPSADLEYFANRLHCTEENLDAVLAERKTEVCKNCKHYADDDWYCDYLECFGFDSCDYCSHWEKKEDADENGERVVERDDNRGEQCTE